MPLAAVQEKLKSIPDEYLGEVYDYLELLEYKVLYKKQQENFPVRKLGGYEGKIKISDDFES